MDSRFSLVRLEKWLGLVPWAAAFAIWLVIMGVLLVLYLLDPGPEMGEVVGWMVPLSFLVIVPGLGGFVVLMMRSRRGSLDIALLEELRDEFGGVVVEGSFLHPLVRPRLLASLGELPVEVLLSPPMPRRARLGEPERVAARALTDAVSEALDDDASRLGTATWPQLEVRVGTDFPFRIFLATGRPAHRVAPDLEPVPTDATCLGEGFTVLSDRPAEAASRLADRALCAAVAALMRCNAPWATQLTLRPAVAGHGAGLHLLSVAADATFAGKLARALTELTSVLDPGA